MINTNTELAVIIVSWQVHDMLDRCLSSLKADIKRTGVIASIWVVDNASTDGSAAMVRDKYPKVRLLEPGENLGFVRANNLALAQLEREGMPEFVWLLNPDTEVLPRALGTMLDFLHSHPRAGLIGPQLLNSDGSLQPGAFRFPGIMQPLFDLGLLPARFYETRINGRYPAENYANTLPFRVDHPLGAAMLARREAIQTIGPLDEQFFMYCEEIDWAWRMHANDWEVWLVPTAKVLHHGGASSGQARPAATAHLWESRARLYRKHHSPLPRALVRALVRHSFTRKLAQAESEEWADAYRRIITTWEAH